MQLPFRGVISPARILVVLAALAVAGAGVIGYAGATTPTYPGGATIPPPVEQCGNPPRPCPTPQSGNKSYGATVAQTPIYSTTEYTNLDPQVPDHAQWTAWVSEPDGFAHRYMVSPDTSDPQGGSKAIARVLAAAPAGSKLMVFGPSFDSMEAARNAGTTSPVNGRATTQTPPTPTP